MPFRNDFGDVVIPQGATGNLGRIILTRNVPPELDAHYGGLIIASQTFGVPNSVYSYIALHASGASLRFGSVIFAPNAMVGEAFSIVPNALPNKGQTIFGLENDVEIHFGNAFNGTSAELFFNNANETIIRADNGLHIRGVHIDGNDGLIRDVRKRMVTGRITNDVGFTTTETVVMSVTAPRLLAGRIYEVETDAGINASAVNSRVRLRFRLNNISGAILNERQYEISSVATTTPYQCPLVAEYEPSSLDVNRVFVLTAEMLTAGTGNLEGPSSRTSRMWVDYATDPP